MITTASTVAIFAGALLYLFIGIVCAAWTTHALEIDDDDTRHLTLLLNMLFWPLGQLFLRSYLMYMWFLGVFERGPDVDLPQAKVVTR